MTADRTRGVVIYASAVVLLLAGGFWWFSAAPGEPADPLVAQWEATAMQLLPDLPTQSDAGMVTLPAGAEHQVNADVGTGGFVVSVVCVGRPDSMVRVSLGVPGTDSGQGLRCSGDVTMENFSVALAGALRMRVSVNDAGPVVFRYSLLRTPND